jgi:hypothetical protein
MAFLRDEAFGALQTQKRTDTSQLCSMLGQLLHVENRLCFCSEQKFANIDRSVCPLPLHRPHLLRCGDHLQRTIIDRWVTMAET